MHLPQQYIRNAIHNPLLFQQNNPLISQSMSLMNSRHKKSHDSEMEQWTSKGISSRFGKKDDEIRIQSQQDEDYQSSKEGEYHNEGEQEDQNDQVENIRAIKQFEREIEEKYKISVSNKLYTFPRLKITSIMDIISSSESDDQQRQSQSKQTSQNTENQFNPFNPKHNQPNFKTEYFQDKQLNLKSNQQNQNRNFKKVKSTMKKDKEKKNSSLKKEDQQNYSYRQKPKQTKKNPQMTTKDKEKEKEKEKEKDKPKSKHISQKGEKVIERPSYTKTQQQWAVKQPQYQLHKKHYAQRLKTEMNNESSGMSDSITESRKRFYEEEFVMRK